jgi:GntR family transcriptional regulator/MocR family aminotransferase
VQAYEQLLAEGYVVTRRGSATRVAARPIGAEPRLASAVVLDGAASRNGHPVDAPTPPPRYNFRPGLPDGAAFPRRAWLASLRRALAAVPDASLGYPDPRGPEPMRRALAAYLNRARGTVALADLVVACTGFTQGLRLVCQALRERGGRRIAIEDPCHAEQRGLVERAGLRPVPIPVDRGGLRVDRLCRADVDAALVTPAHQFPTGAVLTPERRGALLDWAARRRAVVVEDDFDAEYRYDREPIGTLQGLAPDRVVYAGSASKTLAPALRLGWLLLPAHLAEAVARAKRRDDLGSPTLEQLAFADFVEHAELDRHLRKSRLVYRRRRDALITALDRSLPELRVHGVAAGLHVMVELCAGSDERAVIAAAALRSVAVYGVSAHRSRPRSGPPALVLGYGAMSERDIAAGIERLAAAVRERPT